MQALRSLKANFPLLKAVMVVVDGEVCEHQFSDNKTYMPFRLLFVPRPHPIPI